MTKTTTTLKKQINKIASLANAAAYNSKLSKDYLEGAPHLKHKSLRKLYGRLVLKVYSATSRENVPKILDLGAGEGTVTLPFLDLGAQVTAVDISESQLQALEAKTKKYKSRIKIFCRDMNDFLDLEKVNGNTYDIVVLNSFIHHIPDYISVIDKITEVLSPGGTFLSFQDPLRYDTVNTFTSFFTRFAYFTWRITRGDVINGLKRRLRRAKGIYHDDCREDNVDYHVVRNGVDQIKISDFFKSMNFSCEIIKYFSSESSIWQPVGQLFRLENMFAVIARKY
jgi:2-polyprenyl-3-methyl-5-hydroxy-6-metoxy-1,4-benzoquinol methylase